MLNTNHDFDSTVQDGEFGDYLKRLRGWTSQKGWAQSLNSMETSAKFCDGLAQPLSGITVLTPPGDEDPECERLYVHLARVQVALLESLQLKLHMVSEANFHITIADLVSGADYLSQHAQNRQFNAVLRDRLQTLFEQQDHWRAAPQWRVSGLAFFRHAVVCLLEPISAREYAPMVSLRRSIYQDDKLRSLGVQQPLPFLAHVTLGYYQRLPSIQSRERWVAHYEHLQSMVCSYAESFGLARVEVREFEDMSTFRALCPPLYLEASESAKLATD